MAWMRSRAAAACSAVARLNSLAASAGGDPVPAGWLAPEQALTRARTEMPRRSAGAGSLDVAAGKALTCRRNGRQSSTAAPSFQHADKVDRREDEARDTRETGDFSVEVEKPPQRVVYVVFEL